MKAPKPRVSNFFGMRHTAYIHDNGTWIEPETLCYPSGGMKRKAYALFPDGEKRIVICGIPDTYFSIPAKPVKVNGVSIRGYIGCDENGIKFVPFTNQKVSHD